MAQVDKIYISMIEYYSENEFLVIMFDFLINVPF